MKNKAESLESRVYLSQGGLTFVTIWTICSRFIDMQLFVTKNHIILFITSWKRPHLEFDVKFLMTGTTKDFFMSFKSNSDCKSLIQRYENSLSMTMSGYYK